MKRNLFLRLCLILTAMLSLYSCIHDEIYSSSDPSSTEYTNKSLWKQDEKYITNVMKVYAENEAEIKKVNGIPYWNYATTIDSFDESFVAVPILDNGKVTSVLKVPRHGKKIYFYYTHDESDLQFFQALVFATTKKAGMADGSTAQTDGMVCTRQWISVWLPNNESNPDGSGEWSTISVIKCKQIKDECVGVVNEFGICEGGTGDDGGYTYPGEGGGSGTEPEEETPCEKAKNTFTNTAIKSRYDILKGKINAPSETGYGFKIAADGSIQTNPMNPDAMSVDGMNLSITPTTFGYNHAHLNKNNGRVSIKIFSPRDINTFLLILKNAIANGIPIDQVFGGVVSPDPDHVTNTYQIQYIGDGTDLPPAFTETQLENLKNWYTKQAQDIIQNTGEPLSHSDLQELFLQTLTKMNIHNTVLFKIEGNSTNPKKVNYDEYGNPSENQCP